MVEKPRHQTKVYRKSSKMGETLSRLKLNFTSSGIRYINLYAVNLLLKLKLLKMRIHSFVR